MPADKVPRNSKAVKPVTNKNSIAKIRSTQCVCVLEHNISVEIIKQVNNLIELSISRKYGIGSR